GDGPAGGILLVSSRQHAAIAPMNQKVLQAAGDERIGCSIERVALADRAEIQLQPRLQKSYAASRIVELQMLPTNGGNRFFDVIGLRHLSLPAKKAPDFAESSGGNVKCATRRLG